MAVASGLRARAGQSADRRPRDCRRWLPEYHALRSRPKRKRRPWSSSRRSEYFWNLQRHCSGIVHAVIGSLGAFVARIRAPLSALTASQHLAGIAIVTAGCFLAEAMASKKGRP